jgi:hypothetical protein
MSEQNNVKIEDVSTNSNFGNEIDLFIKHIEAQADIVPLVLGLIGIKLVQESKNVDKFIKENGIIENEEEDTKKKKLIIPSDKFKNFINLNEKVETTNLAYNLLPINFVVSFVSQFDAYIGGIIKSMFLAKPELLNSSEKNILFTELMKFSSIEEAQDFIVEKEVESVLRESHLKQFIWLENKLGGQTLRKDLPSFSDFIEITERRNLFVHCNGIVSRQYLEICKTNKVKEISEISLGNKLNADPAYFNKCYKTLFEIGVKLGQVIWRKLLPLENEKADLHLNNVCYNLLLKGHYKLAVNLLSFATDVLKKHTQEMQCTLIINKALAFYLSNKKDNCKKVLDKHDWSASNDKFKLAIEILLENFEEAINLMKSIGNKNEHLNREAYKEWPLFTEFRKKEIFKTAYKEIFEEELVYVETKPKNLEDILTDLKQFKKEAKETNNKEKEVIETNQEHEELDDVEDIFITTG